MGIPKDIAGKKFGKLLAISPTKRRDGRSIVWLFVCDCGKQKEISGRPVVSGLTKSCGCLNTPEARSKREKAKSTAEGKRYEEIPGHYFSAVKRHAKEKGREFTITRRDVWEKFVLQDRKCALSGVQLKFYNTKRDMSSQTASLDRINSAKGYTPENVQWVHKEINAMKRNHSDDVFVEWCKKVVEHNKRKRNE